MEKEAKHELKKAEEKVSGPEKKDLTWKIISGILFVLLILSIFTNGFGSCPGKDASAAAGNTILPAGISGTFTKADNAEICKEDGKPVIRLFSTTMCPHCQWIKETFDKVALEYVNQGKIVAHHWEFDAKEDTISAKIVEQIPEEEVAIYKKFNPDGTVPTFVFGCKYYRIGNGFEREGNSGLVKEEAEFRSLIDELVASS